MSRPVRVQGDIVLNYYDSLIHEEDIQLLEGPHWLNDTLIGFYMDYLEHEVFNNVNVCFIRPEITQCLKLCPDLEVFLDPLEFKFKPYALMTLNDCNEPNSPGGSHWSLLIFSRNELKFYHMDSSEGTNDGAARDLASKIACYLGKKLKCDYQSLRSLQQLNSYDCGVFVLCNLDNVMNHIFKRKKMSTLELITDEQVSKKRNDLKKLIIALYKREVVRREDEEREERMPRGAGLDGEGGGKVGA